MQVSIENIDTGKVVITFNGVINISEGVFAGSALIHTKETNYIINLREGEMLVIDRNAED